jgi:hypothetical protein
MLLDSFRRLRRVERVERGFDDSVTTVFIVLLGRGRSSRVGPKTHKKEATG